MAKLTEWPGAFKALEAAYKQIAKNPEPMWFFVGVYTVVTAASMLAQGVSTTAEKGYQPYADAIVLIFIVPLINYALAIIAGKSMTIGEFMQFSFRKLLWLLVLSVLVAFIIFGSILLFILPVIWTLAWFTCASYVLVDRDLSPIAALKESKRISKDHKGKVWGIIGVTILVSIVAGFFSIIPYVGNAALAFATVLTTVATASLYKWLSAAAGK